MAVDCKGVRVREETEGGRVRSVVRGYQLIQHIDSLVPRLPQFFNIIVKRH